MHYFRTFTSILLLVMMVVAIAACGVAASDWPRVIIAFGAAVVMYAGCNCVFRWTVPRRYHHVPALAISFTGAFLFSLAAGSQAELWRVVVAAVAGAFLFLYVVAKLGTPQSVSLLVHCTAVSSQERCREVPVPQTLLDWMKKHGLLPTRPEPPWVWPYHFEVAQGGSVAWHLYGVSGTEVTIKFNKGFDPFSEKGAPPSEFKGQVGQAPGVIAAGPVVKAGRGPYEVCFTAPGQAQVCKIINNGGGSPDKHS